MGYFESLSKMVSSSGFTLKELADKCLEYGVKITPSYISKLQTNKQSPASDDVNIALAKACGWDAEIFLYESYLEKAPELLKTILCDTEIFFRKFILGISRSHYPSDLIPAINKQLNNLSEYEFIKHALKYGSEYVEILGTEMKDIKSAINYEIGYTMSDDSMSPLIEKGSLIQIEVREQYNNGDFIVSMFEDEELLVRRYVSFDDKVILLPENRIYEVKIVDQKEIKVLGKVTSIIKSI